METKAVKKRIDWTMIIMVVMIVIGFIMMHDLLDKSLLGRSAWDSYTLQALAWREGNTYLPDANYTWLELAEYDGHYYVSFPPLPSVVVFPLTFVFGEAIPGNLLMMVYGILIAVFAYKLFRKLNMSETLAAFLAVFYVFGSNLCAILIDNGVWWHAQTLCVLLCTLAVYCAVTNRRMLAYVFVALSVGCRPFSIILAAPLFAVFYIQDMRREPDAGFWALIKKQLPCFILPVLIGCAYMFYNFIRFDNPLEFGHNYLPEFVNSENGQFSLSYIFPNLMQLLFGPITFTEGLRFEFTEFNGFMFFIANPIFLILIFRVVYDIMFKRFDLMRGLVLGAIVLNLLFICAHKTLGGWQFGARYTLDFMAMALLYLVLAPKANAERGAIAPIDGVMPMFSTYKPTKFEIAVCIFGLMFNLYGAVYFWRTA